MSVSVIIPTYNYGRYLLEAIVSVQAQNIDDMEIIVVDDGSTDNTRQVLASIREPRLKVVHLSNQGVSAARNHGIELSRGDFIAFLDADDRWLPNKIRLQLELMQEHSELGLIFTDFIRFDEKGYQDRSLFSYIPELRELPVTEALNGRAKIINGDTFELLVKPRQLATWVQTCLLQRNIVSDVRFPVGVHLNEDFTYMARIYQRVKAAFIPEPLVEVRRHGSNSYSDSSEMLEPKVYVLQQLLREPMQSNHRLALRQRLGIAWAAVGYMYFNRGKPLASIHAYLRALAFPGRRISALAHIIASPLALLRGFVSKTSSR